MSNEDYNPKSIDATLARIEEKVDQLIEFRLEHEKRISKLEQFRWWAAGVFAAVMAFFEFRKR